jgi:hypothetical protein
MLAMLRTGASQCGGQARQNIPAQSRRVYTTTR